jgi:ABC-type transporter Mla subunit MlaD
MPPVPDPIAPVVSALTVLVTPNPAAVTSPPQAPSAWEPPNTATDGSLYAPITALLDVLFAASSDMTTVGKGINTALTDVASVVTKIADQLAALPSITEATDAMNALQSGLALAQTLAPSSASAVLTSGSNLFQTLQNLLSATGSIDQSAAEMAQLAQQLTALSQMFPAS